MALLEGNLSEKEDLGHEEPCNVGAMLQNQLANTIGKRISIKTVRSRFHEREFRARRLAKVLPLTRIAEIVC